MLYIYLRARMPTRSFIPRHEVWKSEPFGRNDETPRITGSVRRPLGYGKTVTSGMQRFAFAAERGMWNALVTITAVSILLPRMYSAHLLKFSAVVRECSSRMLLPRQPICFAASARAAASERSFAPNTLPPEKIIIVSPLRAFASCTAANTRSSA